MSSLPGGNESVTVATQLWCLVHRGKILSHESRNAVPIPRLKRFCGYLACKFHSELIAMSSFHGQSY